MSKTKHLNRGGQAGRLQQLLQDGLACHQRGQFSTAQAAYEQILRVQPTHFDALQLLGTVSLQTGKLPRAKELLELALRINPKHIATYNNLGIVLKALRRPEAALNVLDKALSLEPAYADAHFNRGLVLQDLGRLDAALESLGKAVSLRPGYAEAHYSRGLVLQELAQPEAALAAYRQAISLRAFYPEAYNNLGNVLRELKEPEVALAAYEQAIVQHADYAEAYYNRSFALQDLQQLEAALASCDKAISLRTCYPEAYSQRGNILLALGHPDAAMEAYNEAIRQNAEYADAHWNRGLLNLLRGDFASGWSGYEWRWKREGKKYRAREFSSPAWRGGEPLDGKTILLYAEQGLGDTLQFCRYVERVAALGAKVVLEVPETLIGILSGLHGVSQFVATGDALPDFDCHCPLLSLPLAFGTDLHTIPGLPVLAVDPGRLSGWKDRLGAPTRLRVGLVWSGSAHHANDNNRSVSLERFVTCLADGPEYLCLQKEIRDADRAILAKHGNIQTFCDELTDFVDTAALCELVDVVISVDTSVAHLSATLGKPTWILLPFAPDWRWLLGREDSPWYPSARLYRQTHYGDWSDVLARVSEDLRKLAP